MFQEENLSYLKKQWYLIPLFIAVPFTFFPRIIDGDSQPWVLIGAFIAFAFLIYKEKITKDELIMGGLVFISILTMFFREGINFYFFRFGFILSSFYLLWVVLRRIDAIFVGMVFRITIIIWVFFGLYQTLSINSFLPVIETGRFGLTETGVPSFTAEPSFFGGFLTLMMLYLAFETPNKYDLYFYFIAAFGLFLSGSLLAFLSILFVIYFVPWKVKFTILAAFLTQLIIAHIADFNGVENRLNRPDSKIENFEIQEKNLIEEEFEFSESSEENFSNNTKILKLKITSNIILLTEKILQDKSINLRFGHVYYVFIHNIINEISFKNDINFQTEYNHYTQSNSLFIEPTGSRYILPTAGEIVFHAGLFGLILIISLLVQAWKNCNGLHQKLFKLASLGFFLISPYSIASFFMVAYITQKSKI